jgi:hypothetical protein
MEARLVIENDQTVSQKDINLTSQNLVDQKEDIESGNKKEKDFQYKEGGYGWLVVAVTVTCAGITDSMLGNYSLVQDELLIAYNTTDNFAIYAGTFFNTI